MSIRLSRRGVMRLFTALAGSIGFASGARAEQKAGQAEAEYQDHPKGQQRCDICVNFQPPNQCAFVTGPIKPQGWCAYFAAREDAH